ncbi:MAG: cation diffusion facilitator family transporter [Bacillota bacterium]|nr:cation diffusion facilitator family transporter [Bacillota bacterium]
MKLLCKILRLDPDSREGIISGTSALGIIVNLLIAAMKVILGMLANSIAIISEGVNNASDALTSVLTLVGTKLAGKKPDAKHPFGHGRIEYLTSLTIAILIIVTGVEMLISAVGLIFKPEEMDISVVALAAVAISAVIKFFLGIFTIKQGKRADSGALVAVGLDCRNDSFVSVITILSAVVFLVFDFSVDAYVGVFTSLLILKAGVEVLLDTLSELLGRPGDAELAAKLYKEIRATEGVLGAADMMLHNYGPEAYSGSVNIEIDHEKTVGEIYEIIHALQLRIMREYKVTMVFGIYAVDNDHEDVKQIRKTIADFVVRQEHVKSFHAVYLDPNSPRLYCDLIVDYDMKDWDFLRSEFTAYMGEHFPRNEIVLTVETEFV